MRTLGVDLSSDPKKTASCVIDWTPAGVRVDAPVRPCTFESLVDQLRETDVAALDAPFGWPVAFVAWVVRYSEGFDPGPVESTKLRLRETDWFVHARRQAVAKRVGGKMPSPPLSVSSDKIAATAHIAGRLLAEVSPDGTIDRVGGHGVVEAYPAATIELLGLSTLGYKDDTPEGRSKRLTLLREMEELAGGWLVLDDELREAVCAKDHDFDAFVCSLTARMSASPELVWQPHTDEQRRCAPIEGWIQVPCSPGVFAKLAG